ncbi:hypothetical protein SprV_0301358200 [Sparganum proliferum]
MVSTFLLRTFIITFINNNEYTVDVVERQTEAHQAIIDVLRQTGQSSHDVVPDGEGNTRVSSLGPEAITPEEGVAGTHLLLLALFGESSLTECDDVHLVSRQSVAPSAIGSLYCSCCCCYGGGGGGGGGGVSSDASAQSSGVRVGACTALRVNMLNDLIQQMVSLKHTPSSSSVSLVGAGNMTATDDGPNNTGVIGSSSTTKSQPTLPAD